MPKSSRSNFFTRVITRRRRAYWVRWGWEQKYIWNIFSQFLGAIASFAPPVNRSVDQSSFFLTQPCIAWDVQQFESSPRVRSQVSINVSVCIRYKDKDEKCTKHTTQTIQWWWWWPHMASNHSTVILHLDCSNTCDPVQSRAGTILMTLSAFNKYRAVQCRVIVSKACRRAKYREEQTLKCSSRAWSKAK